MMRAFKTLRTILNVDLFLFSIEEKFDIKLRPQASNGLWVMFLLPIALIVSAFKNYALLSSTYKLLPLFSFGLIITSIYIIKSLEREHYVKYYQLWVFFPISLLFYFFQNSGFVFSIYSGLMCSVIYSQIFLLILKLFPLSFTLGEAGLTTQACIILAYTLPHFILSVDKPVLKIGQSASIIIQMELFAVMLLGLFLKFSSIESMACIYFWSIIILLATCVLPLYYILQRNPVIWILNLLTEDLFTMKMVLYWMICGGLAALVAAKKSDKATTSERKIFHILAVAVYIPGLIYKCNLLYLGSGILLGIFFLLEIMRNFNLPPLGGLLQASFMALSDHKDVGVVAMTPIYLLTGFTLPLWIHPAPCDVTDSSYFNLLPLMSGILSVGVGDTVASVYGSRYGVIFYPDSKKTYDGTFASILSQLLTIFLLHKLGCLGNMNIFQILHITVVVIITSFVEARTDQIDNAILPLIMYIMLV